MKGSEETNKKLDALHESMDTEEPEWIRIRGTVKHTEYKGKPETRLQRIKQL